MAHQISIDPSLYGLNQQQSDLLTARADEFASALYRTTDPGAKGPHSTLLKNTARRQLVELVREYVGMIRANKQLPDGRLIKLGIPLRKETISRIKRPGTGPVIILRNSGSHMVRVSLREKSASGPSKPEGAAGAAIYVHLGDQPTNDINQWQYYGNYTKTRFELFIQGNLDYGQQVWVAAAWYNPKGELGQFGRSQPIRILGGPNFSTLTRSLAA